MNKINKRKLGIPQDNFDKDLERTKQEITDKTPISLQKSLKDYNYSNLNIRSINIGSLKNPVEELTVHDQESNSYIPIFSRSATDNKKYFYSSKRYSIVLNGEILNYSTFQNIDENNPYDPLFASFDRLYSLPPTIFIQSGITGLYIGEKQKFFNLSSGFGKSSIISLTGATLNVNGSFSPTTNLVNGRTRYLNASLSFPAEIIWNNNPSGWLLRQTTQLGRLLPGLSFRPYYFLPTNGLPTGQWVSTGLNSPSNPFSRQKELEGFFKLSTSRISNRKNKIYATAIGNTGVNVGETNTTLPLGAAWVTYPHSYNIQSYPAFRHDLFLTVENNHTGINDILVISTGIKKKKIVYVSPHKVEEFQGFWSEQTSSARTPITGIAGNILSARPIWTLGSGNLISVTSENNLFSGFNSILISGEAPYSLWNVDAAKLKQTVPLTQTTFYKLYEPVYRKNAFNNGVWNGVIPSGVPFSIETIRTKNSNLIVPKITVHAVNNFVNISPSGGNNVYQYFKLNNPYLEGRGTFKGRKIVYSSNSPYEANYIAETQSRRKAKSRLYAHLWENGITKDNSKTRKIAKLFGNPITPSGIISETKPRYCLPYENPSDPLSCSYTGTTRGIRGIKTRAGLRIMDTNSNFIPNLNNVSGSSLSINESGDVVTRLKKIVCFEEINDLNDESSWTPLPSGEYFTSNVVSKNTSSKRIFKTIPVQLNIFQGAYESMIPVYGPPVVTGSRPILYYTFAIRENDIVPACFGTSSWVPGNDNRPAVDIYDGPNFVCSPRLTDLAKTCGFSDGTRVGKPGVYNACGTFSWVCRRWSARQGRAYGSSHTPRPGKTWKQCGITKGSLKEEMWGFQVTWTPNACAKSVVGSSPITGVCIYKGFQQSYSYTTHPDLWAVSMVV